MLVDADIRKDESTMEIVVKKEALKDNYVIGSLIIGAIGFAAGAAVGYGYAKTQYLDSPGPQIDTDSINPANILF